jgi:hypothetical protein
MLTKTRLAIAAALLLGVASAAQAANENVGERTGGFIRGPQGQKEGGGAVNPAEHRSTRGVAANAKANMIMSDGKCWMNAGNSQPPYHWADCRTGR